MRSSFVPAAALLLLVSSAVAACGGGQAEPSTPSSPSPIGQTAETAPPAAGAADGGPTAATSPAPAAPADGPVWSDSMSKDQKVAFMKTHVVPRMTKVFQAADAKRYAAFGCKTCHGPQFKEPNEFLPHLTMKDGKITSFADKPQISKFMAENVVPEMAAAMGQKPYDPQTHQGFGCAGCHKVDSK